MAARHQGSTLPAAGLAVPLYGKVLGVLRQRIVDGAYEEGDQLRPEDQLAAEFRVSRATVRQAVGELVREDLVARKQGRGTFVLPVGATSDRQRISGSVQDLVGVAPRGKSLIDEVEHRARVKGVRLGILHQ